MKLTKLEKLEMELLFELKRQEKAMFVSVTSKTEGKITEIKFLRQNKFPIKESK